ncbi:unnamed protein product [Schistocephalus solidus]|uniref:Uncharacterized protein n=1 Tax=Schistocephalus solidus TaxID=70667 RepID=A0A183SGK0_SCHSO|nr:unnamed protein product [Schistocephalus solidus]
MKSFFSQEELAASSLSGEGIYKKRLQPEITEAIKGGRSVHTCTTGAQSTTCCSRLRALHPCATLFSRADGKVPQAHLRRVRTPELEATIACVLNDKATRPRGIYHNYVPSLPTPLPPIPILLPMQPPPPPRPQQADGALLPQTHSPDLSDIGRSREFPGGARTRVWDANYSGWKILWVGDMNHRLAQQRRGASVDLRAHERAIMLPALAKERKRHPQLKTGSINLCMTDVCVQARRVANNQRSRVRTLTGGFMSASSSNSSGGGGGSVSKPKFPPCGDNLGSVTPTPSAAVPLSLAGPSTPQFWSQFSGLSRARILGQSLSPTYSQGSSHSGCVGGGGGDGESPDGGPSTPKRGRAAESADPTKALAFAADCLAGSPPSYSAQRSPESDVSSVHKPQLEASGHHFTSAGDSPCELVSIE